MGNNNSAGRKVRKCPYHEGHYVSTNFMRRYVYPGDVVAKLGRDFSPPRDTVETDTHLLSCARKHGKLVYPE